MLTVELVKTIKDAESKADSLIRDAQQEARKMQKEAEADAESII